MNSVESVAVDDANLFAVTTMDVDSVYQSPAVVDKVLKKKKTKKGNYEEDFEDLFLMKSDKSDDSQHYQRLRSGLMVEVKSIANDVSKDFDEETTKINQQLGMNLAVFRKSVLALNAYKKWIDQKVKKGSPSNLPISKTSLCAISTTVNIMLMLVTTMQATNANANIFSQTLSILLSSISTLPPLSLIDGPDFHPLVSDAVQPIMDFIKGIFSNTDESTVSEENRSIAAKILFGVTLARGSLSMLLSSINMLFSSNVQKKEIDALSFIKSLMDLESAAPINDTKTKQIEEEKTLKCPSDHVTEYNQIPDAGYGCDVCNHIFDALEMSYSCRTCDFDACETCTFRILSEKAQAAELKKQNQEEKVQSEKKTIISSDKFPSTWAETMDKFAPDSSLDSSSSSDKRMSFLQFSLIVVTQLNRLSAEYLPGQKSALSSALHVPLRVEVDHATISELITLLDTLHESFINVEEEKTSNNEWKMKMSMYLSTLSILHVHMYQFILSKQSNEDIKLSDDIAVHIKNRLLFLADCDNTVCCDAEVLNVLKDKAQDIVTSCFSFFVQTIEEKVDMMIMVFQKSDDEKENKSNFLNKLTPNVIHACDTFSSSVNMVEGLFHDNNDSKKVNDLLAKILKEATDTDMKLMKDHDNKNYNTIVSMLSRLQEVIFCIDMNGSTLDTYMNHVLNYMEQLFNSVKLIITQAEKLIEQALDKHSVITKTFGEILHGGVCGILFRKALLRIFHISNSKSVTMMGASFLKLALKCLPWLSKMFEIFERLDTTYSNMFIESDKYVDYTRCKIVEYFPNIYHYQDNLPSFSHDRKIRIPNANHIIVTFDSDLCNTRGGESVQLFDSQNNTISEILKGSKGSNEWKNLQPVKVPGDSFSVRWNGGFNVEDLDLEDRGFVMILKAQCTGNPLDWIKKETCMLASIIGLLSCKMIEGNKLTSAEELVLSVKSTHMFDGGLRDEYGYVSQPFHTNDFIDCNSKTIHKDESVENKFLSLLEVEDSKKLDSKITTFVSRLEKFAPDRIRMLPSVRNIAQYLRRLIFSTILRHTSMVSLAVKDATETDITVSPNEVLLKIWKSCVSVKRMILNAKIKHESTPEAICDFAKSRIEFLKILFPVLRIEAEEDTKVTTSDTTVTTNSSTEVPTETTRPSSAASKKAWAKAKMISSIIGQSLKVVNRLGHLLKAQRRRADAFNDSSKFSQLVTAILSFISDQDTLNVDILRIGLIDQRTRSLLRLSGMQYLLKASMLTENENLLCIMLKNLSLTFSGNDNEETSQSHFHSNLESSSEHVKEKIAHTYFDIIERLLKIVKHNNEIRVQNVIENRLKQPAASFPSKIHIKAANEIDNFMISSNDNDKNKFTLTNKNGIIQHMSNEVYSINLSGKNNHIIVSSETNLSDLDLSNKFAIEAHVRFDSFDSNIQNNVIVSKIGPLDDTKRVATNTGYAICVGDKVSFYDAEGSNPVHTYTPVEGNTSTLRSLLLLPDGDTLISGGENCYFHAYSVSNKTVIHSRSFDNTITNLIHAVHNGRDVIFLSAGNNAFMLSAEGPDYALLRTFTGHTGMIWGLDYIIETDQLVTGSYDDTAKIFNVASGLTERTYSEHNGDINACISLGDGLVATGCDDKTVKVWEAATGITRHTLLAHTEFVMVLCKLQEPNLLASGGRDNSVIIWNYSTGELVKKLTGHTAYVKRLSCLADGSLVSGSSDNSFIIWNPITFEHRTINTSATVTEAVSFVTEINSVGWEFRASQHGPQFVMDSFVSYPCRNLELKRGCWYRLGVDYNGSELKLYCNGRVVSQKALVATTFCSFNGPMTIGCNSHDHTISCSIHMQELNILPVNFVQCSKCDLVSLAGYDMCIMHLNGVDAKPDMLRLLSYSLCAIDCNFSYLPLLTSKGVIDMLCSDIIFPGVSFFQDVDPSEKDKVEFNSMLHSTLPHECRTVAWSLFRMIAYSHSQAKTSVATLTINALRELARLWKQRQEIHSMMGDGSNASAEIIKEPAIFKAMNTFSHNTGSSYGTLNTSNKIFVYAFKLPYDYEETPFLNDVSFLLKPHQDTVLQIKIKEFTEQSLLGEEVLYASTERTFKHSDLTNNDSDIELLNNLIVYKEILPEPLLLSPGSSYAIYLYCISGGTDTGTCPTNTLPTRSLYSSGDSSQDRMSTLGGADLAILFNFHDGGSTIGNKNIEVHSPLMSASSDWYNLKFDVMNPPDMHQVEVFTNQYLWLLLRLLPSKLAIRTSKQQKWVKLLLDITSEANSTTTHLLAFRVLSQVVQHLEPDDIIFESLNIDQSNNNNPLSNSTVDGKVGHKFISSIMNFIGTNCFPQENLASYLLSEKDLDSSSNVTVREQISLIRELMNSSDSWNKVINSMLLSHLSHLNYIKDSFATFSLSICDRIADSKSNKFVTIDKDLVSTIKTFADTVLSKIFAALCVLTGQYEPITEGSVIEFSVDGERQKGIVVAAKFTNVTVHLINDDSTHIIKLTDAQVTSYPSLSVHSIKEHDQIIELLTKFISSSDPVFVEPDHPSHPAIVRFQIVFIELKAKAMMLLVQLFEEDGALSRFIEAGHGYILMNMISSASININKSSTEKKEKENIIADSVSDYNKQLHKLHAIISSRLRSLCDDETGDNVTDAELLKKIELKTDITTTSISSSSSNDSNNTNNSDNNNETSSKSTTKYNIAEQLPIPKHAFLLGNTNNQFLPVELLDLNHINIKRNQNMNHDIRHCIDFATIDSIESKTATVNAANAVYDTSVINEKGMILSGHLSGFNYIHNDNNTNDFAISFYMDINPDINENMKSKSMKQSVIKSTFIDNSSFELSVITDSNGKIQIDEKRNAEFRFQANCGSENMESRFHAPIKQPKSLLQSEFTLKHPNINKYITYSQKESQWCLGSTPMVMESRMLNGGEDGKVHFSTNDVEYIAHKSGNRISMQTQMDKDTALVVNVIESNNITTIEVMRPTDNFYLSYDDVYKTLVFAPEKQPWIFESKQPRTRIGYLKSRSQNMYVSLTNLTFESKIEAATLFAFEQYENVIALRALNSNNKTKPYFTMNSGNPETKSNPDFEDCFEYFEHENGIVLNTSKKCYLNASTYIVSCEADANTNGKDNKYVFDIEPVYESTSNHICIQYNHKMACIDLCIGNITRSLPMFLSNNNDTSNSFPININIGNNMYGKLYNVVLFNEILSSKQMSMINKSSFDYFILKHLAEKDSAISYIFDAATLPSNIVLNSNNNENNKEEDRKNNHEDHYLLPSDSSLVINHINNDNTTIVMDIKLPSLPSESTELVPIINLDHRNVSTSTVFINSNGKIGFGGGYMLENVWELTDENEDNAVIIIDQCNSMAVAIDDSIHIYDTITYKLKSNYQANDKVTRLLLLKNNKHIVATLDCGFTIYDLNCFEIIYNDNKGLVESICENTHGQLVLGRGNDIEIYDIETNKYLRVIKGHDDTVFDLDVLPDGESIISCSYDNSVKIWNNENDEKNNKPLYTFTEHTDDVNAVICIDKKMNDTNQYRIATCSDDMSVKVWLYPTMEVIHNMVSHNAYVLSMCMLPDGLLASGDKDGFIIIHDINTGKVVHTIKGHDSHVKTLTYLYDTRMISCSSDHTVKVWNITNGELLHTWKEDDISHSAISLQVEKNTSPLLYLYKDLVDDDLKKHMNNVYSKQANTIQDYPTFQVDTWQRLVLSRNNNEINIFLEGKKVFETNENIAKWDKTFYIGCINNDMNNIIMYDNDNIAKSYKSLPIYIKQCHIINNSSNKFDYGSCGHKNHIPSNIPKVLYQDIVGCFLSMGYPKMWCQQALNKYNCNIIRALKYLLSPEGRQHLEEQDIHAANMMIADILTIVGYTTDEATNALIDNDHDLDSTFRSLLSMNNNSSSSLSSDSDVGPMKNGIKLEKDDESDNMYLMLKDVNASFITSETGIIDNNTSKAKKSNTNKSNKKDKVELDIVQLISNMLNSQIGRTRLLGMNGITSLFHSINRQSMKKKVSDNKENSLKLDTSLRLLAKMDNDCKVIGKVCRILFFWKKIDSINSFKDDISCILNEELNNIVVINNGNNDNLYEKCPITLSFLVEGMMHLMMKIKQSQTSTVNDPTSASEALDIDHYANLNVSFFIFDRFVNYLKTIKKDTSLLKYAKTLLFPKQLINLIIECLVLPSNVINESQRLIFLNIIKYLSSAKPSKNIESKKIETKEEETNDNNNTNNDNNNNNFPLNSNQALCIYKFCKSVYVTQGGEDDLWNESLMMSTILSTSLQCCLLLSKHYPKIFVNNEDPWMAQFFDVLDLIKSFSSSKPLSDQFILDALNNITLPDDEAKKQKIRKTMSVNDKDELIYFHSMLDGFTLKNDEDIMLLLQAHFERTGIAISLKNCSTITFHESDIVSFPMLEKYNISVIKIRLSIILYFNIKLMKCIKLADLTLPANVSEMTDIIRSVKGLIPWKTKEKMWDAAVIATNESGVAPTVSIDQMKANRLRERKKVDSQLKRSCFGQLFRSTNLKPMHSFIISGDQRAMTVNFAGMHSTDAGGPYRELFDLICDELRSDILPLFIPCPNNKAAVGKNRDTYVPNPMSTRPLHISAYEYLGQLMGLCMRTSYLLSIDLPPIIWKPLTFESITREDVLDIDILSYNILNTMNSLGNSEMIQQQFEQAMDTTFEVVGSDQKTHPLLPHGEELKLTWENRGMFVELFEKYRLNEFRVQCDAIQRGMSTIVPYPVVSLFTSRELSLMICGRGSVDLDLLKEHTSYEGCSSNDEHIKMFWTMMRTRFHNAEHIKFLRWVWGRSRLPVKGQRWESNFKIASHSRSAYNSNNSTDNYLPEAHTCFFTLDLPRYSSIDVMYEKMLFAITHCVAIDGDSSLNYGGIDMNADDSDED